MADMSRIEKIVDDLIEIKADLEHKIKERDAKINELEKIIQDVNIVTESQSAEIKAMSLKINFMERKVDRLNDNKIKLENDLMKRDARTSAIEKKLEDFKSITDNLSNKIKAKDDVIKRLQQNFQENVSNDNVVEKTFYANGFLFTMVEEKKVVKKDIEEDVKDDEIKKEEDIEEGEIKDLDVKPLVKAKEKKFTPPNSPQYSSVSSEDFSSSPIKPKSPKAFKRREDHVSDYLKGFGKRRKKKAKMKQVKKK